MIGVFLKGLGMGAANVIPGVSGGTIALVTGIYPRLIEALRNASQPENVRRLMRGEWRAAWIAMDGTFLLVLGAGVLFSILTLARLFDFLLQYHEVPTMAFFFGLVLISIFHVGRTVPRWNLLRILVFLIGTAVAVSLALIAPAGANSAFWYLILCGIAAICSMILPGLSGSFVLMLMGNYVLVLRAIKELDLGVIIPMALGCAAGLLGFVQILGWALKKAPETIIALMTGFVCGSLLIIWPWKTTLTREIEVAGEMRSIATGHDWYLPTSYGSEFWLAVALMLGGAAFLHLMTTRSATAAK